MLNTVRKTEDEKLDCLLLNLWQCYDKGEYLSVISKFNEIKSSKSYIETYFLNLNSLYLIYSRVFTACIMLLDYKNALKVILEFVAIHQDICDFYAFLLRKRREEKSESFNSSNDTVALINILKDGFEIFNRENYVKFQANLAFAYYKSKKYIDAYRHYNIAIAKMEKAKPFNKELIELYVGKAQTLYYFWNKDLEKEGILGTIQECIKKVSSFGDSVEVLFALGKLYYFIKKPDRAINYIELAISKITSSGNMDVDYKIYAYDWLSRIAYSTQRYATANKFYDKLIELIIEDKQNVKPNKLSNDVIYPKPILADMVKYLNETNDLLVKKEASYIYSSIYIGILAACILEGAEIYAGGVKGAWSIVVVMIVLVCAFCYIAHCYFNRKPRI